MHRWRQWKQCALHRGAAPGGCKGGALVCFGVGPPEGCILGPHPHPMARHWFEVQVWHNQTGFLVFIQHSLTEVGISDCGGQSCKSCARMGVLHLAKHCAPLEGADVQGAPLIINVTLQRNFTVQCRVLGNETPCSCLAQAHHGCHPIPVTLNHDRLLY